MKRLLTACVTLGMLLPAGLRAEEAVQPVRAKPAPAAASKAERLVKQLGADDYAAREQAARELARLGTPAQQALEAGTRSSDREIRYSSLRILDEVRQAEFQRRLEAFAEGRDDQAGDLLPGWGEYRGVAGDSAQSRTLFVAMQNEERGLLETLAGKPREASRQLDIRAQEIQHELRLYNHEVPLGSIAALLLAAGDDRVTVPTQASSMLYGYCYQQCVRAALEGGDYEPEVRKLLGRWIARGEDSLAYQGLVLATQYELKEGLVPARRIIRSDQQQQYVVQFAVVTIARLGGKQDIPLLEPLLGDATHLTQRRVGSDSRLVEVQLRDVALAALVHLSGQDFADYGLRHIQPNPQTVFTPNSACFDTDDQRTAAIRKWREYSAEQEERKTSGSSSDKK